MITNDEGEQPTVGETTFLGPLLGANTELHPSNRSEGLINNGTDLGFAYKHQNKIQFLFGDTWLSTDTVDGVSNSPINDDIFGSIDLDQWASGSQLNATNLPKLLLGQEASGALSVMDIGDILDVGRTPLDGFSNGTDEYAFFYLAKPQICETSNDCGEHLSCDGGLGWYGEHPTAESGITLPCLAGTTYCQQPDPTKGLCVDPTSSLSSDSDAGRIASTSVRIVIGERSRFDPAKYTVKSEWLTTKFLNLSSLPVNDFSSENHQIDPALPTDTNDEKNSTLFVWGRPAFVGVGATGRPAQLYFAYNNLLTGGNNDWSPQFYAGNDSEGRPIFSSDERDAVPLEFPDDEFDVVNQLSVSWIPKLEKWTLIYGGGVSNSKTPAFPKCGVLEIFARDECDQVDVGNGAVRIRFSDNPWGPWGAAQDLLVAGNSTNAELQYGQGGALRHPECREEGCAPHSVADHYSETKEYGFFYGANIVDPWTVDTKDGVDIIWVASTWDPYRTVLFRSHIKK